MLKANKQLQELQSENDRLEADCEDLRAKNLRMTRENSLLIEQIKNFERETFEIQTKIQRGSELENESKN